MVNWDPGAGGDRMTQSRESDESLMRFGSMARWLNRTFHRGQIMRLLYSDSQSLPLMWSPSVGLEAGSSFHSVVEPSQVGWHTSATTLSFVSRQIYFHPGRSRS